MPVTALSPVTVPALHGPTAPHGPSHSARAPESGPSHRAHFRLSDCSGDTVLTDEPCHGAHRLDALPQHSERPAVPAAIDSVACNSETKKHSRWTPLRPRDPAVLR